MARFLKKILAGFASGGVLGAGAAAISGLAKKSSTDRRKQVEMQAQGPRGGEQIFGQNVMVPGRAGVGGDDVGSPEQRQSAANIIEALADGASDREIRSMWARRARGLTLAMLFTNLRAGNADAAQNILISNELEKILGRRRPRGAVPKWVKRFVKQGQAIRRMVGVASMVRGKKGGKR